MGVLGQSVGNKHTELADGIFLHDFQEKKKKKSVGVCHLAYGTYLRMVIDGWEESPIK